MQSYAGPFHSLFSVNMGVRPGERIVVFSDQIRPGEPLLPCDFSVVRLDLSVDQPQESGFAGPVAAQ